jgi:hypothetical protein
MPSKAECATVAIMPARRAPVSRSGATPARAAGGGQRNRQAACLELAIGDLATPRARGLKSAMTRLILRSPPAGMGHAI